MKLTFIYFIQIDEESDLLQPSLYSKYIDAWLSTFSPENLLILNGDNFIKAPWEELDIAQKFLGIGTEIDQGNYKFDKQKG